MKKLLMIPLIISLALIVVGCNNGEPGGSRIVLSYADWADDDINQALIDSFMEEYPHIRVELRKDISGTGGEFTLNLLNAQAAGVLPDVFAIDNVPTGYTNGMILDITEYWDADPETAYVYPNAAETAIYNGSRYAIPSFQFIKGILINMTLLDRFNIDHPPFDWTYEDMYDLAVEIRRAGDEYVYGIEGWFGDLDFEAIWPTQDCADTGYQTWDGERFHFNSDPWINAYERKLDLYDEDAVADYDEDDLVEMGVDWPWAEGYVGMNIEGSWMFWMIQTMYQEHGQEVGFWPYPGGEAGQFPPTILDYIVVSSETRHPEEAYKLAKWMTFGREGWHTRIDIMEEQDDLIYLDRFPVADFDDVWDRIDPYIDMVYGLRASIDLLEDSKPDVDKWLPGYKEFWEWVEENEYWDDIFEGNISPSEFAPEWEEELNRRVREALEEEGQED